MTINLTNKRYGITGQFDIARSCWIKHTSMHPTRPEEVLQNNLSVCYGMNTSVTSEMIEKVIEDEYRESQNLSDRITEARKIWKDTNFFCEPKEKGSN